jgi:hypothetical protein
LKIRRKRLRRRFSRMSIPPLRLVSLSPSPDTLYIACMIANPRNVFFDIDIAGEKAGRIVFKLYDDIVPKVRPLPFFIFGHKLSNRPQQTSEDLQLERNPIRMKIYLKDSDTKGLISIELSRVL